MAVTETVEADGRVEPGARERILDTAYELFSHARHPRRGRGRGDRARRRRQGDPLPALPLEGRPRARLPRAARAALDHGLRRSGGEAAWRDPEERLLAIFDVFDEWFRRDDFEACSFINVLLEMGPDHPPARRASRHLENIRSIVRGLAEEAGLRDPESFARSWHILMKGSIVSAAEGDTEAAQRAKSMARCSSTNTPSDTFYLAGVKTLIQVPNRGAPFLGTPLGSPSKSGEVDGRADCALNRFLSRCRVRPWVGGGRGVARRDVRLGRRAASSRFG